MKKTLWLGLVPIIPLLASGAWWMINTGSPPTKPLTAAPDSGAAIGGHPARNARGTAMTGPRLRRPPASRSYAPPALTAGEFGLDPASAAPADRSEGTAYNLDNPFDRELLAQSLQANGVSEEDIRYAIKYADAAADITDATPGPAYDLNDPNDAALLAESLRAQGVQEEDLQYALKSPADDSAPTDVAQGQAYDTNDPFDRQALAQWLAAQGVREEDIGYAMKEKPGENH